jgi:DNA-binding transcriptional regulator YiaG
MKIKKPTPAQILEARQFAQLTQPQAAELVHARNYNTWANWEADRKDPRHRSMPLAAWELFLIKTHQLERLAPQKGRS